MDTPYVLLHILSPVFHVRNEQKYPFPWSQFLYHVNEREYMQYREFHIACRKVNCRYKHVRYRGVHISIGSMHIKMRNMAHQTYCISCKRNVCLHISCETKMLAKLREDDLHHFLNELQRFHISCEKNLYRVCKKGNKNNGFSYVKASRHSARSWKDWEFPTYVVSIHNLDVSLSSRRLCMWLNSHEVDDHVNCSTV